MLNKEIILDDRRIVRLLNVKNFTDEQKAALTLFERFFSFKEQRVAAEAILMFVWFQNIVSRPCHGARSWEKRLCLRNQ